MGGSAKLSGQVAVGYPENSGEHGAGGSPTGGPSISYIRYYIHTISIRYNMDKRQIIQSYFYYIIRNCSPVVSSEFLDIMEYCLHNYDVDIENLIEYFYYKLRKYYTTIASENKSSQNVGSPHIFQEQRK